MNIKTTGLVVLLGLLSMGPMAEDKKPQTQLDEVKGQIKTEQEANQKLKDDLAARDKEIADLKQKLKELEEKTGKKDK
jgi:septal ring factor EnvC (AmiA/AmiB activator)